MQDSEEHMTQIKTIKAVLLAGALSGASAWLLCFTLFNIPFLPVFFGIGVNIPVLFVLFSAGWRSGLAAALLAGLLLCLFSPLEPALLLAVFFFIPALFTGSILGLKTRSRAAIAASGIGLAGAGPAREKHTITQFYPLSAALFQLALAVSLVTIAVLFCTFSTELSVEHFDNIADRLAALLEKKAVYDLPAPGGDIHAALRRFLPVLLAVSLALYGFLFQLAALYCAMRLARRCHSLHRPFGYWPADLRLPPMALFLFIGLWIVSYCIGNITAAPAATLSLCVNTILAALAAGFCVAGLAALHQTARGGWAWLRIAVYLCLFSLVLTPVIFFGLVIMGLFATPFSPAKAGGSPPLP